MVGRGDVLLPPFAVQDLRHSILTSVSKTDFNSDCQYRKSMT